MTRPELASRIPSHESAGKFRKGFQLMAYCFEIISPKKRGEFSSIGLPGILLGPCRHLCLLDFP